MKVNIASWSLLKAKEYWDQDVIELAEKVILETIQKSNLQQNQVEAIFLGNCFAPLTSEISNIQQIIEEKLRIKTLLFSGTENCSALAVQHASQLINTGKNKNIVVVASEKLSNLTSTEQESVISTLLPEEMRSNGMTMASLFALAAQQYMQTFSISREDLAKVPVLSHKNALNNPLAQFKFEISQEQVLKSPLLADPLHVLDSAAYSDGAAAILLSANDAKVSLTSSSYTVGNNFACIKNMEYLLNQASFLMHDINVVEVYDNYSITEVISLEKLGLCPTGKA